MMKRLSVLFLLLLFCAIWQVGYSQNNTYSDTLNATHYNIHLDILDFDNQEISGKTEVFLTLKTDRQTLHGEINGPHYGRPEPVTTIYLELLDLTIDSVLINSVATENFTHQNPLIEITPEQPIYQGDTVLVTVFYHGHPFSESWGGFHYSGEYAFNLGVGFESIPHNLGKTWFPCIDDFHDRASYDVFATVYNDKSAVGGGMLMDVIDNGNGTSTWHWHMENTIPTYLASIAVGNYVLIEDTFSGINDDIQITYYVRPSEVDKVAGSFIHMHDIMEVFEERFGPYQWPRVGYVGTAIGAMEHATNIAYPHASINGGLSSEWLYAHELAHMWFGDMVTCAAAEEMWINEGWAVFCESIMEEGIYGYDAYISNINRLHAEVLQYLHTAREDGDYYALNNIPQEITYGMHSYDKGGLVIYTLRNYMGDELFFEATKGFLQEFAFNHMSSIDLMNFITANYMDVDDFFEAWILSPGFPHFSLDSFAVSPSGDDFFVDVYLHQKSKGNGAIANSNRVEVTFLSDTREMETRLMEFSGETGHQEFAVPFEPVSVFVDYHDKICDATTDDEIIIYEEGEYDFYRTLFSMEVESLSDSAFVRVTHHWVPPDSLSKPQPGLTLSDYRYWSIDGILPDDFIATGRFVYQTSGYLDNNLITSPLDSLIILYRERPGNEWEPISFTQQGPYVAGMLKVANLKKGDYTLAIWDDLYLGKGDIQKHQKDCLKLYPNPGKKAFTFDYSLQHEGLIKVYSDSGQWIETIAVSPSNNSFTWDGGHLKSGTYFLQVVSNEKIIAREKLIILK